MNGYQIKRLRHKAQGEFRTNIGDTHAIPGGIWRGYSRGTICSHCDQITRSAWRRWHYETDPEGKSNEYDERFLVIICFIDCDLCGGETWIRWRFDTSGWTAEAQPFRPGDMDAQADMLLWV